MSVLPLRSVRQNIGGAVPTIFSKPGGIDVPQKSHCQNIHGQKQVLNLVQLFSNSQTGIEGELEELQTKIAYLNENVADHLSVIQRHAEVYRQCTS
jgi:hypothetical protein